MKAVSSSFMPKKSSAVPIFHPADSNLFCFRLSMFEEIQLKGLTLVKARKGYVKSDMPSKWNA